MAIIIDPTVPANTEAEALGAARMRAISSALQQMFGGQGTTALSFVTNPFDVDGSSGLTTVPGNPTNPLGIATKQYVDATTGNAFGGGAGGDLIGNYPNPQVAQSSITTFTANNISTVNNITAGGNLQGVTVTSTQDVVSDRNITANSGTIQGKNITATSGISCQGNLAATGSVSAASISATGSIQTPAFNVTGAITAGTTIAATGTVSGANAAAAANLLALGQLVASAVPAGLPGAGQEIKAYFEIPCWTGSSAVKYIVQFGFQNRSDGTLGPGSETAVTFGLTFPNGVICMLALPTAQNSTQQVDGAVVLNPSTTGFSYALHGSNFASALYWLAIGW